MRRRREAAADVETFSNANDGDIFFLFSHFSPSWAVVSPSLPISFFPSSLLPPPQFSIDKKWLCNAGNMDIMKWRKWCGVVWEGGGRTED